MGDARLYRRCYEVASVAVQRPSTSPYGGRDDSLPMAAPVEAALDIPPSSTLIRHT
jgi:hypothetical protein